MSRLFAVVPAAGKSARMGRPKLRLPLGKRSVIEHVVDALRVAHVKVVVVVIGPHVADLAPLVERAGGFAHVLAEETADMRTTVLRGLEFLEAHDAPEESDDWLLVPADHPVLDPSVVRQLTEAKQRQADRSIFIPTHEGRRGHPALMSWSHAAGIRAMLPDEGINKYLRRHADDTLEVPVTSPTTLLDLDTPEDYERIKRCVQQLGWDSA